MQEHTTAAAVIIFVLITGTADKMPIISNRFAVIDKLVTILTASAFMSSAIIAHDVITNPGVILTFVDNFTAAVTVSNIFFVHNLSSSGHKIDPCHVAGALFGYSVSCQRAVRR